MPPLLRHFKSHNAVPLPLFLFIVGSVNEGVLRRAVAEPFSITRM